MTIKWVIFFPCEISDYGIISKIQWYIFSLFHISRENIHAEKYLVFSVGIKNQYILTYIWSSNFPKVWRNLGILQCSLSFSIMYNLWWNFCIYFYFQPLTVAGSVYIKKLFKIVSNFPFVNNNDKTPEFLNFNIPLLFSHDLSCLDYRQVQSIIVKEHLTINRKAFIKW